MSNVTEVSAVENTRTVPSLFADYDHYKAFRLAWKKTCSTKERLTSEQFALYAILRGRDLSKLFTPITNEVKLINGMDPYGALKTVKNRIAGCARDTKAVSQSYAAYVTEARDKLLAPFGGTVTQDMLMKASATLNTNHR